MKIRVNYRNKRNNLTLRDPESSLLKCLKDTLVRECIKLRMSGFPNSTSLIAHLVDIVTFVDIASQNKHTFEFNINFKKNNYCHKISKSSFSHQMTWYALKVRYIP